MNDHVTFETASRLAEAGFPAPSPAHFDVWFCDGYPATFLGGLWRIDTGVEHPKDIIFAPTATDILKEISGWYLFYSNFSLPGGTQKRMWSCRNNDERLDEFYDDNPAEAAAMAWMAINEKK